MARIGARPKQRGNGVIWLILLAALLVGLAAGAFWLKRTGETHEVDTAGCLTRAKTPNATLFLLDATDRLKPETARYVVDMIRQQEAQLPRYSRVLVVPFGDDVAKPLQPLFKGCLPGGSKDAGVTENGRYLQLARDAFDQTLGKLQGDLEQLSESKTSPIAAQVVRAASDTVLGWSGEKRRLVLLTDGLESSIYWSRELKLPDPPARLLDGVEVEFVELGNAKAVKLQSEQMRQQWKAWFEKAGASVKMAAPGYAAD